MLSAVGPARARGVEVIFGEGGDLKLVGRVDFIEEPLGT